MHVWKCILNLINMHSQHEINIFKSVQVLVMTDSWNIQGSEKLHSNNSITAKSFWNYIFFFFTCSAASPYCQ